MILGRVSGEVVATIKHGFYVGHRLLMVDRLNPDGSAGKGYVVAIANVEAGVGDTVLVVDEGNSARSIVGDPAAPLRSVIVGVVDEATIG
ncbi:MAG: EutN/CcmL family microcompartment protein [Phycisphaerales bacterium]|nr:EutN/CcmL family microcompartment protein [Phycisphaerales bacterium]